MSVEASCAPDELKRTVCTEIDSWLATNPESLD
jgi:hypothetical protein